MENFFPERGRNFIRLKKLMRLVRLRRPLPKVTETLNNLWGGG